MNEDFNVSRDDPWNRAWLTSREMFTAFNHVARHGGEPVCDLHGGTLYEVDRGTSNWVQVWVTPTEVIVAYPAHGARYNVPDDAEGLHEFDEWVRHLRGSEPLELGRARGRSSYGATCAADPAAVPVLKWAQRGDWMFHWREWPVIESEWATHRGDPERMLNAPFVALSERQRRLLATAFSRNLLPLITDDIGRRAIEVAEEYCEERATEADLRAAHAAAYDATEFWRATGDDAFSPNSPPGMVAWRVARVIAQAAYDASEEQTRSERLATDTEYTAWATACAAQCDLIREVFGNPFNPVAFAPAWLTSDVVALARGIYDEKAFDRMPILADALQDAGCDSDNVLNHCRDPNQVHVRGCWVIDGLLGR